MKVTDSFCYLGSTLSNNASLDKEIDARLAKANAAFGALRRRLWDDHGVRLDTKVAVYRAVVLTTLLYGSESWTTYRHQIKKLDRFHMKCLRQITHIKWQDYIPNTTVLNKCKITGIEAFLIANQLRWAGHVARMDDQRIPKRLLYGQLSSGTRAVGAPIKRYKDQLKANLEKNGLSSKRFAELTEDRNEWRRQCHEACVRFEQQRIDLMKWKREKRKDESLHSVADVFNCSVCNRVCRSKIELYAHQKIHTTR